jgi:hypothetical protein
MSGAFHWFSTITIPTSSSWLVGNESGLFVKLAYCSTIALMVAYGFAMKYHRARLAELDAIPTVGPSGLVLSYWGALKFFVYARDIVEEGYTRVKLATISILLSQFYSVPQYHGKAFKIPQINKWLVVVSGERMVEDIRRAPDDTLSLRHAIDEVRPL